MDRITYDDVYEIAAEVAEETITKFLQNLIKLVPVAEDVVDDIKEQQYAELRALKQNKSSSFNNTDFGANNFVEQQNEDFAAIAGKSSLKESLNIDSALSQIPLEKTDLLSQASNSAVENTIIPQSGLEV